MPQDIFMGNGTVTYAQLAACGNIALQKQGDCRPEAHAAYVTDLVLLSISKLLRRAAAAHLSGPHSARTAAVPLF